MSLSTGWFKSLSLFSAGIGIPLIYAQTTLSYCNAEQLRIYPIASNFLGMMKSNSLYGVINISQKSCLLKEGIPTIWGISKQGKIYYLSINTERNDRTIVVEPASKTSISSDKLVWFSIDGHGDVEFKPSFNTLHIMLPGITRQVYTVPYHGFDPVAIPGDDGSPTRLQKNAALWLWELSGKPSPELTGKVWPIYFTQEVSCTPRVAPATRSAQLLCGY